jgi:hypothetical protein
MAFLQGPTNFVNRFLYNPCARPIYIYVLTFLPAFFDAWLLVRLFDFNDIVRERGKYLARKGSPTGRALRHTIRREGKAPPQQKERYSAKGSLKHFIVLTQPLEIVGFAMLMYGAVDGFYKDWDFYLDLSDSCLSPEFYGPLHRKVIDGVATPNEVGGAVQLPTVVQNRGGWATGPTSVSVPIGRYTVIFAVTVVGPGSVGGTYALQLFSTGVLGLGLFTGAEVFCAPQTETTLIEVHDVFIASVAGGSITWEIVGPPVPVGLSVPKASVVIQRQESFIKPSTE